VEQFGMAGEQARFALNAGGKLEPGIYATKK